MNRFIFTQPGGFPLTQERLAWLQDSSISASNAIAGMSASITPVSLIGVELTGGDWLTGGTVSDGWVNHPTLGLMPFVGGAFTPSTVGVSYQDVSSPLTFGNNVQYNVQIKRIAQISAGGVNDLKALSTNRWYAAFGKSARTDWVHVDHLGGFTGDGLYYCIDKLTNVAHIRGSVTRAVGDASNLGAFDGGMSYPPTFSLPLEIRPPNGFHFRTSIRTYGTPAIKDFQGNYFTGDDADITLGLNTQVIYMRWRNLQVAGSYTLYFNFSYPLF